MNIKSNKINLLAVVFFLLSVCPFVSAQKQPACVVETENMLFEADNLEKYKDLSSAKADDCVKKNPKSVEAFIVRSKLLALKGDFDLALTDANKAIELSPQSSDAFYARGFAYEEKYRSKYDASIQPLAMADYEKALKLNPKNGLALLDKTYLRKIVSYIDFSLLLSDYDLAIQYLKAGGNSADLARAYGLRGLAYASEYIDDKAINDYTTALNLRPNYIRILDRRGDAYQSDKKPDAAIADYSEYLKVKPSARIFVKRAGVYEDKGEISKAVDDYRAALALEPNHNTAKTRLAKLAPTTQTATVPPPATMFNKTAEQFAAEGKKQLAAKDYWGAIDSFSQCLVLKPDSSSCHAFLGFALGMINDLPTAQRSFETAIKLGPNQAEPYFLRGMMYAQLGKKNEAIIDLRAALKLNPNHQQAKAALQRLGVQP